MLKRIIALLLVSAVLLCFTPATVNGAVQAESEEKKEVPKFTMAEIKERETVSAFPDTVGHWAEKAINRFAAAGVIVGDGGLFRPDDPMTRAEFAVILMRVMRYKSVSGDLFDDLEEEWYTPACQALRLAGVMRGDENNLAHPYDPVSREEAVALFARAFNMEEYDSQAELPYADADDIQDWARGNVAALTNAGYLHGSDDNRFFPADPLTRAECMTILDNLITAYFYEPGDYDYMEYEGEADFVIVGANDVNIMYFDIFRDVLLTEDVDYRTVHFRACNHYGSVLDYQKDGTTERRFKSSMDILPINNDIPRYTHNRNLFVKDEKNIMHYADDKVQTWFGVDVSSHQGDIDWKKLKEQGVYFAFIRCGYRGYSEGTINADKNFEQNVKGAYDAGIKVGVYFYSQAINVKEAREEADFVLAKITGLPITFPVVFDWESMHSIRTARSNHVEQVTLCQAAEAFCSVISNAGYRPMLYSNSYDALHHYLPDFLDRYEFWYADYKKLPMYEYDYDIWQYGSFELEGVKGLIDLNISFVDYSARN